MSVGKNTRLVFSTDPKQNKTCEKCGELLSECTCVPEAPLKDYKFVAVLRIEKKGRGGKTVTVIDQLPKQEVFLRDLTSELKKKCGSGGTYIASGKEGVIEIQGDKRELIKTVLASKNIKTKG
jgi:translation initiation factor 1